MGLARGGSAERYRESPRWWHQPPARSPSQLIRRIRCDKTELSKTKLGVVWCGVGKARGKRGCCNKTTILETADSIPVYTMNDGSIPPSMKKSP